MTRTELAQQIIDTCLKMNASGLNQGTSGNVSARWQEGMLITPSGVPYEKLTPDSIVYMDSSGQAEADKIPSSEWHFHLSCYQARPELNAVVHNHALNTAAVSILNESIPAIHYMVAVTGTDHVPCVPYATFGTHELADIVAEGIKTSKALIMQHHGMLVMEINLEKALWLAHETEVLSALYLKVRAITPDVPVLSSEEMQRVLGKFKTYGLKTGK
ncbi:MULTISPECIES: L-fuculose-phosphate aldolase [unclassified Morganella (in: enterobacteria)]|uniref:L-fuculose-phosphate aldolase n=1 Tax=unclassified Morganella (in: enterobacteria) TaxID=2676694 RepID=UPI00294272B4|nr:MULTISPECIES: L-fuculose-phosphate aldolase [unclassified Morganella (in: enterobacteria)]